MLTKSEGTDFSTSSGTGREVGAVVTKCLHCLVREFGKGTATLEPEPTQHSKPTFVWVYEICK